MSTTVNDLMAIKPPDDFPFPPPPPPPLAADPDDEPKDKEPDTE
jgi:hypothetical protein